MCWTGWTVTFGVGFVLMLVMSMNLCVENYKYERKVIELEDEMEDKVNVHSLVEVNFKDTENSYVRWGIREADKMFEEQALPKGNIEIVQIYKEYFFKCTSLNGYEWMRSQSYSEKSNCERAMKTFAKKRWEIQDDNR